MTRETLLDPLTHPLLRLLDPSTHQRLGPFFTTSTWPSGRVEPLPPGLWVLVRGRIRLQHHDYDEWMSDGQVLGVESLWTNEVPPARVEASTPCVWSHLTPASFTQIQQLDPAAALHLLLSALQASPGRNQRIHTPSRGPVRAPTRSIVGLKLMGREQRVSAGTLLDELLPERHEHLPVVAALVDNKATSLSAAVTSDCEVEPLTTREWEGQRIYRHSLSLLALEAAHVIAPDLTVRMGPSVGFGRRILAGDLNNSDLRDFAERLEVEMNELRAKPLRVNEQHWTVAQARDYFASHGWENAQRLLDTWRDAMVPMVSYGAVYVINSSPIVTRGSALDGCFILYDDNLVLLVYGKRGERTLRPSEAMPPSALNVVGEAGHSSPRSTRSLLLGQAHANHDVESEEQAWLGTLGVTSVGAFNHACVSGSVPDLIRVAEGFQEKRLTKIADEIQSRKSEIDIVCIAGPSASGKTTFIRRLCVQLQVNGIRPVALGLDDYYIDRVLTPVDASGDYDFESLAALQLELLEEHLTRLMAGNTVTTARYDFGQGKSYPEGGAKITLGSRDVLLLEGIHGLNPNLLGSIPKNRVFRIFVCPLMQLAFDQLSSVHASDVRLIRRIVRDRHARGYGAAETIARWPKVRAGERQHIYPYQAHSDAVFDSSLIYELSVLRVYAERYLLEIPSTHTSRVTAFRLMHLLDRFVSIYPDHVPATSILREFVGGSGFET